MNRYRYKVVTREDGRWGLEFDATVDAAVDADARRQLDALGGPLSRIDVPGDRTAPDGLRWTSSPDARLMFANAPESHEPEPSKLDLSSTPPYDYPVRRIKVDPEKQAAADATALAGEE